MTFWLLQILVPTGNGANLGIDDSPPGPMTRSNGPPKGGCKRRDSLITAWRIGNVDRRLFEGKILLPKVFNSKWSRFCHWGWVAISYKTASILAAVLPTPANNTSSTSESAAPVRFRKATKTYWSIHNESGLGSASHCRLSEPRLGSWVCWVPICICPATHRSKYVVTTVITINNSTWVITRIN